MIIKRRQVAKRIRTDLAVDQADSMSPDLTRVYLESVMSGIVIIQHELQQLTSCRILAVKWFVNQIGVRGILSNQKFISHKNLYAAFIILQIN